MLSVVTLDDADGNAVTLHSETGKRQASKAKGFVGVGTPRFDKRVRPQAHGGIGGKPWEDGKIMLVEGDVSGTDQEDAFAQFGEILVPMIQTWDHGPAWIKWTEAETGLQKQRLVTLASEVDPVIEEGAALLRYQAQFFAEDPRAYSQTLTTAVGDALFTTGGFTAPVIAPITVQDSTSGTVAVNNEGTRPTPPVFRIYGYATSAQIVLVGGDARIALTGTIAPGDYLEIDVQERTLRLNGTSPAADFLDAANTTWFELPKGTSTMQLIAGANDSVTRLDVLYRSAY